ncbi:MAG: hypothetical protein KDC38_01830 [Planctomycetes bacterium]|nr:hypothetical protein [Planctomycetota bacterium]
MLGAPFNRSDFAMPRSRLSLFTVLILLAAALETLAQSPIPTLGNDGKPYPGPTPQVFSGLAALGPTSAILYAPSAGDSAALRNAIATECGGAIVDYFDASSDTPSLATLLDYDAVIVWANFAFDDGVLFGDTLADYVDAGGRVFLGAFCTFTNGFHLDGRIMSEGYCPVVSPTGGNHYSLAAWSGNHRTCAHDCAEPYEGYYRDELDVQSGGEIDSTYDDFEIAVAARGDRRVFYFNGLSTDTTEGWPRLIGNALHCGTDVRILVYDDGSGLMADAGRERGYTVRVATSSAQFLIAINGSTEWDIVVLEASLNTITANVADATAAYIAAGGRAILSYWDLDGSSLATSATTLRDAFSIAGTLDFTTAMPVNAWDETHPLWTSPSFVSSSIAVDNQLYADNGDFLEPAAGAYSVAGFSAAPFPGQAAVVIGSNERTIANGFLFANMDPTEASDLAGNQLQYLASREAGVLVLEQGALQRVALRAARRAGYWPAVVRVDESLPGEIDRVDWDLIIVEPPCCGLGDEARAALVDYIDAGGRVLLSYWNLDTAPDLQAALGVAATTEMLDPMPVYQWALGNPMFTTPNFVSNPIAADPMSTFTDNGDLLTVAPGATALGGYAPGTTAGEAAIIVANDGRTIVNGFDYDSVADCDVLHLVENQIELLTAPLGGTTFRRGDCNGDATFDISDTIFLLSELFTMGPLGVCRDACDDNDDGTVDISDAVYALSALFVPGASPIPGPHPDCGVDPTADGLGCAMAGGCP